MITINLPLTDINQLFQDVVKTSIQAQSCLSKISEENFVIINKIDLDLNKIEQNLLEHNKSKLDYVVSDLSLMLDTFVNTFTLILQRFPFLREIDWENLCCNYNAPIE